VGGTLDAVVCVAVLEQLMPMKSISINSIIPAAILDDLNMIKSPTSFQSIKQYMAFHLK
jgi:hypothetical protein